MKFEKMLPVLLWDDELHEALTVWFEDGRFSTPKILYHGTIQHQTWCLKIYLTNVSKTLKIIIRRGKQNLNTIS